MLINEKYKYCFFQFQRLPFPVPLQFGQATPRPGDPFSLPSGVHMGNTEPFSRTTQPQQLDPNDPNVFECPICHQHVRGASSLRYHKMRHEGRFPYVCPYCGHGTPNTINMKKHLRAKHTGKLGYHCTQCDLELATLAELKSHLDTQTCRTVSDGRSNVPAENVIS